LVMMSVNPALSGYKDADSWNFAEQLVERAKALPGVAMASVARNSPLSGSISIGGAQTPGHQHTGPGNDEMWMNVVGPDYFKTLGTPLLAGRTFTDADRENTGKVTIINEKTASHFWPRENPIGKHLLKMFGCDDCEVVGVVKDSKYHDLRAAVPMTAYQPIRQVRPLDFTLHARVSGSAAPAIAAL